MTTKQHVRSFGVLGSSALLAGLTLFSANAQAGLNLATDPLFMGASVQPNIMFTLDDSGSMHWEITPDDLTQPYYAFPIAGGIYGGGDYTNSVPRFDEDNLFVAQLRSAHHNTTYYNPEINYQPWIKADETRYEPADEEAAYHNPHEPQRGSRNLTEVSTEYARWYTSSSSAQWTNHTFYPATYYIYEGGSENDYDSYTRVEIRDNDDFNSLTIGGENRTDCDNPTNCTYDEEIQNFANWYQYHRSRILAARGGIAEAFADLNETVRIGYGSINSPGDSLATFNQDVKADFFESLYGDDVPPQGTPLRGAAQSVGDYFETDEPWEGPDGELLECRLSYHILMTDGYWNESLPQNVGNVTGSTGPVIEAPDGRTYQYEPRSPIEDSYSNTLADVAMDYWVRDLRPDLNNRVPVRGPYRDKSGEDGDEWARPGFWQHLVTLGVGLGVEGAVSRDDAYNAVSDNDPDDFDWGNPHNSDTAKIDDLLRASIGTRGDFFSAMNPAAFAEELGEMLNAIVAEATRSASVTSTNTSFAQEGTRIYQAQLDSEDWSGDIYAYEVDSETGQVLTPGTPDWLASENMPDEYTGRNIVTWFDDNGATFDWATISDDDAVEQAFEDGVGDDPEQLVAYLRGDNSNEASEGGAFRTRSSLIGDIVNSDLQFVGTENYGFTALPNPEGDAYRVWRRSNDTYTNRPDMIYVASNAGMLHAINVEEGPQEGREMFAYVPGDILERLPALADPDYSHEFFVDGSPTVSDAYMDYPQGGTRWGTVLVGTTGLGGRSVFALDITDPENFSENNVLWEFSHDELGYGVQDATITRLDNGQWVAVFGNGYNSDSHGASLFVVDLATGDLLDHVEADDNSDADDPNGMAGPVAVDMQRNATADWFYAGDLKGNLWRFDVNTTGNVSLNATNLFETATVNGRPQPITTRPVVGDHPDGDKLMVYVGTGKFLEEGDNQILANEQMQSFYAVIDDGNESGIDAGDLLTQSIVSQGTATFGGQALPVRTVSENDYSDTNPENGWRINLDEEDGERVITPARVIGNRIRFASFTPTDDDPCISGGINWIMEMNAISGARLLDPVYDFSGDGEMDFGDGGFQIEGPPISGDDPGPRNDEGKEIFDPNPENPDGPRPETEPPEDSDYYGRQSWQDYR